MSENLPTVVTTKAVANFDRQLDYTDRQLLDVLKQTVAKGTSDPEFKFFIELCQSSGFNPLKKEIWCFKSGDKLITMVGINGFFERANAHPMYDGMELECDNELSPTWVKCIVYRKDRSRPTTATALLKEFKKNTPLWQSSPYHMLCKVAKAIALREAFSQQLSGLYIPEEIEGEPIKQKSAKLAELEAPTHEPTPEPKPKPGPKKDKGDINNRKQALLSSFELLGVTQSQLENYCECSLEKMNEVDLQNLGDVYKDIKKGMNPSEFFVRAPNAEVVPEDNIDPEGW